MSGRRGAVAIELSLADVDDLIHLAHFYERSMGPMRFVVRLTAPSEIRAKYRFIAEESHWLQRFAERTRSEFDSGSSSQKNVEFATRALVAYWGRILASLNQRRSRRRLKGGKLEAREALELKFRTAAQRLQRASPDLIEREFSLRRPVEVAWMREGLIAELLHA